MNNNIEEEVLIMNKELEEAIKILKPLAIGDFITWFNTEGVVNVEIAVETVIQALENSIPKEVIEKKIEELKNKSGGNTYHVQSTINSNINLLQELLEENIDEKD